jgi:hypothetical protein
VRRVFFLRLIVTFEEAGPLSYVLDHRKAGLLFLLHMVPVDLVQHVGLDGEDLTIQRQIHRPLKNAAFHVYPDP